MEDKNNNVNTSEVLDTDVQDVSSSESPQGSTKTSVIKESLSVASGCGCMILGGAIYMSLGGIFAFPSAALFTWVVSKWTDKSIGKTFEFLVDKMLSWSWVAAKVVGVIIAVLVLFSAVIWIVEAIKKKNIVAKTKDTDDFHM